MWADETESRKCIKSSNIPWQGSKHHRLGIIHIHKRRKQAQEVQQGIPSKVLRITWLTNRETRWLNKWQDFVQRRV